jgi:D-alanyl-D-alanine carboxypeptidase
MDSANEPEKKGKRKAKQPTPAASAAELADAVAPPEEAAPAAEPATILETPTEVSPVPENAAEAALTPETSPALPAISSPVVPVARMPTMPQLLVALGILALIFGISYLPFGENRKKEEEAHAKEEAHRKVEQASDADPFKDTDISASAAYVWDIKNQKALYNKNAGSQLPLASLTKLMTAIVAYEHLGPQTQIPITAQAVGEVGDSQLASGETFTLRDLANLTLVTSSNDGAAALAAASGARLDAKNPSRAFIDAMNAKAEEIGLSRSYFTNPTGLDVSGQVSGSYGSARDMAFLMEYLVLKHPEILESTTEPRSAIRSQEGLVFTAVNTNEITREIPGLLGSKTGFTSLAGGNLVIAYDAGLNRPIVIAVLGSTREGRFSDVKTLLSKTAAALAAE